MIVIYNAGWFILITESNIFSINMINPSIYVTLKYYYLLFLLVILTTNFRVDSL